MVRAAKEDMEVDKVGAKTGKGKETGIEGKAGGALMGVHEFCGAVSEDLYGTCTMYM